METEKNFSFSLYFLHIITVLRFPVKGENKENAAAIAAAFGSLLFAEGLTVGALILSRIAFMSAHQNAVQRAVVLGIAVICAGLNGAFDALVCIAVHNSFLLLLDSALVWLRVRKRNMAKLSFSLLFYQPHVMMDIDMTQRRFALWPKLHLLFYLPTL